MHKNKEKIYIGPSGRQFKTRFYEHTQSYRSAIKKESIRLSRFVHKIKKDYIDWKKKIKWEIVHRSNKNRPGKFVPSVIWRDLKLHLQTTNNF